jgi:hypothetical protein
MFEVDNVFKTVSDPVKARFDCSCEYRSADVEGLRHDVEAAKQANAELKDFYTKVRHTFLQGVVLTHHDSMCIKNTGD